MKKPCAESSASIEGSVASLTSPFAARLHALDSLRAVAMLLGIVLHSCISFMRAPAPWVVHDINRSVGFDLAFVFIHGFRMQLFFLLAGFFGHLLWQREGARAFLIQRWRRIGIPLLGGLITIVPLILCLYFYVSGAGIFVAGQAYFHGLSGWKYPTVHLWFLEILMMLYVAATAASRLQHFSATTLRAIDTCFDTFIRHPLKPLVLVLPTVLLSWGGPSFVEIENAGTQLLPSARAFAYYALFFGTGWFLHRRISLLNTLRRYSKSYLLVAAAAYATLIICLASRVGPTDPSFVVIKTVALSAAALYAWTMTFALTGVFLQFASRHRPWVRYMADASYWFYLWHLPMVLGLQIMFASWQINALVKLCLILCITFIMLLCSYQAFVRYTWLGALLNGPRRRPRDSVDPAGAAST